MQVYINIHLLERRIVSIVTAQSLFRRDNPHNLHLINILKTFKYLLEGVSGVKLSDKE